MAEIINLDELVPEDVVFKYQGKEYVLPGDISTESVFKLFKFFREMLEAQKPKDDEELDTKEIEDTVTKLKAELLILFQERDPSLKDVPFGVSSMPIVMQTLLAKLGVEVTEEGNPTEEEGKKTGKMAPPKAKPRKSRQSSGSRSS